MGKMCRGAVVRGNGRGWRDDGTAHVPPPHLWETTPAGWQQTWSSPVYVSLAQALADIY